MYFYFSVSLLTFGGFIVYSEVKVIHINYVSVDNIHSLAVKTDYAKQ